MCFNAKPPKQKYNYKVRKIFDLNEILSSLQDRHPVVSLSLVEANPGPGNGECGLRALEHRHQGAGGVQQRAEEVGGRHQARGGYILSVAFCKDTKHFSQKLRINI